MARRTPALLALLVIALMGAATFAVVSSPTSSVVRASALSPSIAAPSTATAAPLLPPASPRTVPVGGYPDALLVDPTNNTAFVSSEYGDNVTAISLSTDHKVATIPVGYQPYPQAIALDPVNWTVYVVNSASGNVSVISIAQDQVIASVPVGASPNAIVYNPDNKDLYVANGGSGTVSIISAATHLPKVVATIPVGPDPDGLAVDSTTHDVFVADAGTDNLTVISEKTNQAIKSIPVGTAPAPFGAIAYDPQSGDIYVVNVGSGNVSAIGGKNLTLFATIAVGSGPDALVVDQAQKELFVINHDSDNASVIATVNDTVIATIPLGEQPGLDGAVAYDATTGYLYVPNSGSGSVSVISAAKRVAVASVEVGELPDAIGVDLDTGAVFVANQGSASVTTFDVSSATFDSLGLPAGSTWSIALGSPATVRSNTTVRGRGTISFVELTGTLGFTAALPTGYAISKITGPDVPNPSSINLTSSPSTFVITFGPVETLTFSETGLPTGTSWSVALASALAHGGPAPQRASSTTSTIAFSVVKDAWKYTVTRSSTTYRVSPSHGSVAVGDRAVEKKITFTAVTAPVDFEEDGLAGGTHWWVSVTGPMDVNLTSKSPRIVFHLVNGTYTFHLENFTALHPFPAHGTFTVVAPHAALVESISYTSTPRHAAPFDRAVDGGALPGDAFVAAAPAPLLRLQ